MRKARSFGRSGFLRRTSFYDRQDLIGHHICQLLLYAGGPCQFNPVDHSRVPQSEVYPLIAGRIVADGGGGLVILSTTRGGYLHLCSQSIPVIGDTNEVQNDPMIMIRRSIDEQLRFSVQDGDHNVDLTVVVDIAEGSAAVRRRSEKASSRLYTDILKLHFAEIAIEPIR